MAPQARNKGLDAAKWLAVLPFLLVAFSGCIEDRWTPSQGSISTGAWATYRADDGTSLRVEALPRDLALDAYAQPRDALWIRFTLAPETDEEPPLVYEEALDPTTGLVVQHVEACEINVQFGDTLTRCSDDRRSVVHFGHTGLPGALGAGILWPQGGLLGHDLRASIESPFAEPTEWTYAATRASEARASCWSYQTEDPFIPPVGRVFPLAVTRGPIVACHGLIFPARFQVDGPWSTQLGPEARPTFHLVAHGVPEKEARSPPSRPIPQGGGPYTQLHVPPSPFFLDDHGTAGFSSREAHLAALRLDPDYARLAARNDSLVVRSDLNPQGEAPRGVGPLAEAWVAHERHLVAATGEAGAWMITLRKESPPEGSSAEPEISVEASAPHSWAPSPDPDVAARPQTTWQSATELATRITGSIADGQPVAYRYDRLDAATGQPSPRADGYRIILRLDPGSQASPGIIFPLEFQVDGPSGAIRLMHLPVERQPFTCANEHHAWACSPISA